MVKFHRAVARLSLVVLLVIVVVLAFAAVACAPAPQVPAYPTKPIEIIVSYAPGGTSDVAARLLADWINEKKKFPVPVQVVNRAGGSGSIGQAEVMNSPADGYKLVLEAQMAAAMPIILPDCPFQFEKRTWIASMFLDPYFFIAPGDSPFKTLQDVVTRAKSDPASFSYGTTGPTGTSAFMVGLLLKMNGVDPQKTKMVAFQGGGEYVNAVAGGHVMFAAEAQIKSLVDAGKLKALAVVAPTRHPDFPNVPTVAEAGFSGFPPEFVPYNGISGPPGLPQYVVDTWAKVIKEATDDPVVKERAKAVNKIVMYWGPDESKRVMFRNNEVFKELAPVLGLTK